MSEGLKVVLDYDTTNYLMLESLKDYRSFYKQELHASKKDRMYLHEKDRVAITKALAAIELLLKHWQYDHE